MTSPKLRILERQLNIQRTPEKIPAPAADGLAAAIKALIQQEVAQALANHQEPGQRNPRMQAMLRSLYPPVPPPVQPQVNPRQPSAMPLEAQIERDGAGLARAININGQRFLAQRDAAGLLVRVVSADQVADPGYAGKPVKPAPLNDPASDAGPKRAADPTQYQPPKPR